MSSDLIIETECKICGTKLKLDLQDSLFFCPKCYEPYKSLSKVSCPKCGNNRLTKYSGNRIYYYCGNCKNYYNLWDATLIIQKYEERLEELERMNEMFKNILLSLFKEGGLTSKQQGIIQKSVKDIELSYKYLGVDGDEIYGK